MYFSPLQAEKTLQNLQDRLALEGYLILGPNEGSSAAAADFSTSIHKGARIYRKNGVVPTPKSFRQITAPGDATLPSAPLAPAEVQRRAVLPESVVLPDLPQKPGLKTETLASRVTGLMEESRRLADEGNLEQALAQCDEVLKLDRLNSTAFYFRAIILQEKNEPGEARASLQRAIYLDPNFVLAHFALGNLARTMAKPKEAQKHFDNALTLAEKLPLDQILAESEGLAVSRLIEMIRILKLNFSD
jgi:chemotaxis protein methyltransferase CheR